MASPGVAQVTGVILAGGLSSRFGSDKASARFGDRPLLQWVVSALEPHCSELLIVRAEGQVLPDVTSFASTRTTVDVYARNGPLAGLVAGFALAHTELAIVAACDAPLVQGALLAHLLSLAGEADIVCGSVFGGLQPFAAVYRPAACLEAFRARVEAGQLRLVDAFEGLRVRVVEEPELRRFDAELLSYADANTPEALAELERCL
jgi:molybdopterin-guanine dinucleotide biosynthesis protein A